MGYRVYLVVALLAAPSARAGAAREWRRLVRINFSPAERR